MDAVSKEDLGLAQENERLRREVCILMKERDILKKATKFFAGLKQWGLGLSKNTQVALKQSDFAVSLASALVDCGLSVTGQPDADSDQRWSPWRT